METTAKVKGYEQYLCSKGFSKCTVTSYVYVANYFENTYQTIGDETLQQYRSWLVETFKPSTASQRVRAINSYLGYLGCGEHKLASVRVQSGTFLQNAISDGDYCQFLSYLLSHGYYRDYYAVRLMATTGARVSELLCMEVVHMRRGFVDVASKGKLRRILIPDEVAAGVLEWCEGEGRAFGPVFLNVHGAPITARGLAYQLKVRAGECGVDARLVHPHAFRHLFARKFLAAGGDLMFLADLMGHSSVETTRVYLRRTASEQRAELNRLVCW